MRPPPCGGGGGTGIAVAAGDDDDVPITGPWGRRVDVHLDERSRVRSAAEDREDGDD